MLKSVSRSLRVTPFFQPVVRSNVQRQGMKLAFARQIRWHSNDLNFESSVAKYSDSKPVVKYSEEHEWVAVHSDGVAFIGITKYAADALGDATYIELPNAGEDVAKGDILGSVESVKSASDIYSPVTGQVVQGNEALESDASIVNKDPLGEGWFAKIQIGEESKEELDELMDIEQYEEFVKKD